MARKALLVFVDESGNFDFSDTGTNHLVLSAVLCHKPLRSAGKMLRLKYSRLALGFNISGFHASEDRNSLRVSVLKTISKERSLSAFSMVLDKARPENKLLLPGDIYHRFGLELAAHLGEFIQHRKVLLIFDRALPARDEKALLASLKTQLSRFDSEYLIHFHNVSKDLNAQIADYIAWSIFVGLERGNWKWHGLLPARLGSFKHLDFRP